MTIASLYCQENLATPQGHAHAAVEALSDLAELLRSPPIAQQTAQWSHRYSLSDSVFLTHPDPVQAVRQARDLVFNLAHADVTSTGSAIVRGALACGEIRHVRGIFLASDEPATSWASRWWKQFSLNMPLV